MNRLTMMASAILLASPVASADDQQLCETHLEQLEGHDVEKLQEPGRSQIEEHIELARQAARSGDADKCIVNAAKALQELEAPGEPHTSERGPETDGAASQ